MEVLEPVLNETGFSDEVRTTSVYSYRRSTEVSVRKGRVVLQEVGLIPSGRRHMSFTPEQGRHIARLLIAAADQAEAV